MGKITKTAGERHEITLSPFIQQFIEKTISIPTRELRTHLQSFPELWPFPRGDLYHWIPALNRFDDILSHFNTTYELDKGPQTKEFGTVLAEQNDDTQSEGTDVANGTEADPVKERDEEIIKSILKFSMLLLTNCGNRSLYASSDRMNDLLNTVDVSLLQITLQLSLLLAKRYYASKQRISQVGGNVQLSSHYNISVDRVRKLAAPFAVPSPTARPPATPSGSAKGKEKKLSRPSRSSLIGAPESKLNGSDLVSIVKNEDPQSSKEWADISMTIYPEFGVPGTESNGHNSAEDVEPDSPSIRRTATVPSAAVSRSSATNVIAHRRRSMGEGPESSSQNKPVTLDLASDILSKQSSEDVLLNLKVSHSVPENSQFELLQKVRTARALISNRADRCTVVGIRLLAIANLAYIESEASFYQEFARPDSEQPRQLQVTSQLAELVQPASDQPAGEVPLELQTIAILTMDALTHQKFRANDVYTALNANVNHGILFYMLRKAVDQLGHDEPTANMVEEEWREALFSLLASLPSALPRAGEMMMAAGLLDILLDALKSRTSQADRTHWKCLTFLDNFIYSIRDGYQSLANAKGLDMVKELSHYIVTESFKLAQAGKGMPQSYKAPVTDYQIPFFQQTSLRWLFKFVNHLMNHNAGNFSRQMRNLIDSSEMLESFKTVMSNANVFGSNVWAGAVSIWTTFIHNEPTSYSVIAESKLDECFLKALMQPSTTSEAETGKQIGLLPVSEAINAVPQAFQALCLNEAGMKMVIDSGALSKFFAVFTSPLHVKALDQDRELPMNLGSTFDELCRHQPNLRNDISAAVRAMVSEVAKLCRERAVKDGFGAKLWVDGGDGKLYVAGGRKALAGGQQLSNSGSSDIEMTGAESDHDQNQMSMEEVVSTRNPKCMPFPTAYIGAATRFLLGYLANSTMCSVFMQEGGLEDVLDFATSPCLPFNFELMNCGDLEEELGKLLTVMADSKVHILLPSLVKRLQLALNDLSPLYHHDSPQAVFGAFTNPDHKMENQLTDPSVAAGTVYVKSMVVVSTLCNALALVFSNPLYNHHRQSTNYFTQVNLVDVWVDVIDKLGKLQRSCTWEEILLAGSLPDEWTSKTMLPHPTEPADEITNRILRFPGIDGDVSTNERSAPDHPPTNGDSNDNALPSNDSSKDSGRKPQFENTRVLRHLFYYTPQQISHFFNQLGKTILIRRSDPIQKRNAIVVADQLAKSMVEALTFEAPEASGSKRRLHEFWYISLLRLIRLIIDDSFERTSAQTLTLILRSFKEQNGFAILQKVLESFVDECNKLNASESNIQTEDLRAMADTMGGIKNIFLFYSKVINAKFVMDAQQTQAMTGRLADGTNFDVFSVSQFLVEMRHAVLKPTMHIWSEPDSVFMSKASPHVVRNLIEILKIELDAEGESKALSRNDKVPRKKQIEPKKWTPKNTNDFDRLSSEFTHDLATEALYRCYDNTHNAQEYCEYASKCKVKSIVPLPKDTVAPPSTSKPSSRRPESAVPPPPEEGGLYDEPPEAEMILDVPVEEEEDDTGESDGSAPRLPDLNPEALREMMLNNGVAVEPDSRNELVRNLFAEVASSRDLSQSPAPDDRPLAGKVPGLVTVDDLNDDREQLREGLIDRCLEVLRVHDNVTFELSELIFASVGKGSSGKESRTEVGSLLLMALTSFEPPESAPEEELRDHDKRITSYAHLLALILAKDDFYNLVQDQLVDAFPQLVEFIQPPNQKVPESSMAISNVLLVLERLLCDDAAPQQIEYKPPNPDADNIEHHAVAELRPPLINLDNKQSLFDALMKVLPSISKDESLALSILRIMVVLTRNRKIAVQLGEKPNLRRLFLMARQLHGMTNERIQSAFMIVLRHIVEDEETLRNIMRNEIVAAWSSRSAGRPFDTTSYARHFSHLAIRSPEIFVKATNDKVMINSYNSRQVPQQLKLKEDPAAEKPLESATSGESSNLAEVEKSSQSDSAGKDRMDAIEKTKSVDLKMPVVENPDGVIHFILSELLDFRVVNDIEPAIEKPATEQEPSTPSLTDVEMGNASSSSTPAINGTAPGEHSRKSDKATFKADDHPVYIYRCFLLQCLTELLACYNRTKIEFINFKRKVDTSGTTPSKPRSQVLNYLLHDLIPTGFLGHPEDIPARKREKTSSWAMSVIVALCSKTGEGGFTTPPSDFTDYKEEPELLFVRKFVLEHAIKAYKDAMSNETEGLEGRYSKLLSLADLFNRMLTGKPNGVASSSSVDLEMLMVSQRMLAKIMYEKNFISAMTSSVAEIDLNFPNAKRAVKYILKPLKLLTQTANDISMQSDNPVAPGSAEEDEISSDSSVSDIDDTREQTPDLFRNSALGMMEPNRDEDTDESEEDDENEDDDGMFDAYDEEMEYEDDIPRDHDEVISDEDEEITEMGPIEGLPGDVGVDMEIVGMEVEDEDDSDDDEDDSDEDSEDEDMDEDVEGMEGVLTIDEDEEGHSIGADDEDWGTEPDDAEGYPGDDDIEFPGPIPHNVPAELDEIVHILEGDGDRRLELLQRLEEDGFEGELPGEHELLDGDMQEDEEDEEEDYEEEEIAFEPEMDDEEEIEMARGMPWGWDEERGSGRHHLHIQGNRHGPWGLFSDFRDRIFPPTTAGYHRSHRSAERRSDDGTNPLLQRSGAHGINRPPPADLLNFPGGLGRFEIPADGNPAHFINNLINAMSAQSHLIHQRGGTLHVQINNPTAGGMPIPRDLEQLMRGTHGSRSRPPDSSSRPSRDDPSQAVLFTPSPTTHRWGEESKILFAINVPEKATQVVNAILRLLVPPAIEEKKRKDKEEAERQKMLEEQREKAKKEKEEAERKEKEEKEAREKKEREEREAKEAEEAARAAEAGSVEEAMEGVEATSQPEQPATAESSASATDEPAERITTMIDGREIDITNLGIDPEYLAALPDDMRQEVIMEQTLAHRQTQADSGGEQQELDPEFLQALPPEMRDELMQQVALDRRRREREEARRRNATTGGPPRPDDIDAATFLATLDPALRNQVLMEVDEDALNSLPAHLQAEARQLSGHHHQRRLDHYVDVNNHLNRRNLPHGERAGDEPAPRRKPTTFLQILDKAGVATLLRLMFIPQSGSIRNSLNGILRDVCRNRQNRAEVVSILLSILQDGSNDIVAVERSFSLLSIRAKQPSSQKTPQPKRASPENGSAIGEVSPITVVQQCLVCLDNLVQYNPRIAEFFLSEHETGTGFKPRSTRKGKGKEMKAVKYPINALLGLLDRKIIIESAPAMELLASLLQRITHPLLVLLRKEKEKEKMGEDEKKEGVASESATDAPGEAAAEIDVEMTSPEQPSAPDLAGTQPEEAVEGSASESKPENKPADATDDKDKKRTLTPPDVPEYNLRLIINIIAARECPSKTFKDTLSLITNLSTIPEAKEIFGQELIHQAQDLGRAILLDLDELSGQINRAANSADVQGMALAKFSPASSDQAKLLRVITALDFLFDPKRAETQDKPATADAQGMGSQQKEDILTTLYENQIFVTLWSKLSQCLSAIHTRGNMFNVANILLPLIEVLMVVCKNTSLKDAPIKNTQHDFSLSSPEPESREARMENLFFSFTEDHRKILNELVRHSPKLMSGSFSLLVKNSKVLEFDNKRNYFNRRLHSRTSNELRQPHPSLQLNVRRDQVFLDSFKHLYYKKPDEFKFGKLSIRFAGEEGVDAGGVTREWFQALTKQMFDPNYALFIPVASDRTTFHPNSESAINEQHLTFFKFIGRVIGKALYEGRALDCHFSRALYKRILSRSISIKDMESLDNDYSKNLQWMLDNEISGLIAETFSVQTEVFGETKIVDLVPGGRDIEVTDENKQEYVQHVVEYKLLGSVKEQMEHFLQGFHDIVPADLISIFNEQELELLISGLPDIDVDDWRNNTEYHNYQSSSPQIQWFWRAVRSFDKEERAKLLQFVTGTSKVPLNGFKELEGMNGFSRFNIHRDYGAKDRLPSSHTCFNQLDLPEYDNYEELRKRLYTAITAGSEYFGFA